MGLDFYNVLAGLIGAAITALVGYFSIAKKAQADEAGIALNAWKELLSPMQEELKEAKEEIARLRKALEEAQTQYEHLLNRLRDMQDRVKANEDEVHTLTDHTNIFKNL